MNKPVTDTDHRLLEPDAPSVVSVGRRGNATSSSAGRTAELTESQIASWRTAGYAVVHGLFPDELIASLRADALAAFPQPATAQAERITDFGSDGGFVFPCGSQAFNAVTLHPNLLGAAAQLLGVAVDDIRLTQSDLWPKYGHGSLPEKRAASDNQDQRIHVDYPNHMLAHPTPWDRPEAIEAILYLSEFSEAGGPTAVVPREGEHDPCYPWPIVDTPGVGELNYVNDRETAERYLRDKRPEAAGLRDALYKRERYVRYATGTLLLYRHDVWHRGTPLHQGQLRLAHNLSFRRAECEWISTLHTGWAWQLYRRDHAMTRLIAEASLQQRAVLGFPQPGSSYWCEQTIQAVEARYAMFGMDMTPYRAALAQRSVSPSSP